MRRYLLSVLSVVVLLSMTVGPALAEDGIVLDVPEYELNLYAAPELFRIRATGTQAYGAQFSVTSSDIDVVTMSSVAVLCTPPFQWCQQMAAADDWGCAINGGNSLKCAGSQQRPTAPADLVDYELVNLYLDPQGLGIATIGIADALLANSEGITVTSAARGMTITVTAGDITGAVSYIGRSDHSGASIVASGGPTADSTNSDSLGAFLLDGTGYGMELGTYVIDYDAALYLSAQKTGVYHDGVSTDLGVCVLHSGDCDDDDTVALADVVIVASSFWANSGDAWWDARADLNASGGRINLLDLILVARSYNLTGPTDCS